MSSWSSRRCAKSREFMNSIRPGVDSDANFNGRDGIYPAPALSPRFKTASREINNVNDQSIRQPDDNKGKRSKSNGNNLLAHHKADSSWAKRDDESLCRGFYPVIFPISLHSDLDLILLVVLLRGRMKDHRRDGKVSHAVPSYRAQSLVIAGKFSCMFGNELYDFISDLGI
jgi:hypothetical protein